MNNCFPLDFIRQIIEQTLLEQKLIAPTDYFGGKNEVNLFSFYEQLQKDSEVDRYVEIYQDLVDQQNRSGLIMNGTIIAPENPTITNLYLDTIIPMSFTCSFRVRLGDRDKAITTINNLIEKLKGRKQDVALFENGQIFKVGTICNQFVENESGLQTHSGDYIGEWDEDFSLDTYIETYIGGGLGAKGIYFNNTQYVHYYMGRTESDGMIVVKKVGTTNNGTTTYEWKRVYPTDANTEDILFPPERDFEKYKVSMSFDSIRCDEPRNLNAKEYCTISFGGSATLVNNGVALGNDLVKLGITRNKIIASPNIVITESANLLSNATWLEPLEMPSGNNANSITNILNSNRFNTNSHTTNITIANQYSFVVDRSIPLLDQLYKYARWGYFGVDNSGETPSYTNAITPNMIFRVYEVNSSWGDVEINYIDAKIVEDISIENTESDTLSMTLTLQKQGGEDISGGGSGGGGGSSTDYVTTDTEQTITAKKTFTNQVVFTNTLSNGTYVYLLPQESGRLATQEWVQTFTGDLSGYVKTSGNQDVNGVKTFKSATYTIGLLPYEVTGIINSIGASGYEWSRVYTDSIYNGAFRNALFSTTGQTLYGQTNLQYNDVDDTPLKITFDNDNSFAIDIVDKDNTSYHCYIGLASSYISHNMKLYLPYDNLGTNNEQTIATQEWVLNKSYATTTALGNYVTLDTAQTITGEKTFSNVSHFNGIAEFNSSSYDHHTPIQITVNSGYAMSIFGDGAQYGYYFKVENENPSTEYELTIPAETGTLATREWVDNYYVTKTSIGNYVTLNTSQTITGVKTFSSAITTKGLIPTETGTLIPSALGGNGYEWERVYADNIYKGTFKNVHFATTGQTLYGTTILQNDSDDIPLEIIGDNDDTYLIAIKDKEANTWYKIDLESSSPSNDRELSLPNESGTLATREYAKGLLTPTQVGTYATTTNISTDSGNYNGFQFNVGTSDNNGLYVFTFGNAMVLLPCYGLQVGTEYKICATLVNSISGGYDNYVLTYRITSNGYLQIYNRRNIIPNGYNAFLFRVKLY